MDCILQGTVKILCFSWDSSTRGHHLVIPLRFFAVFLCRLLYKCIFTENQDKASSRGSMAGTRLSNSERGVCPA